MSTVGIVSLIVVALSFAVCAVQASIILRRVLLLRSRIQVLGGHSVLATAASMHIAVMPLVERVRDFPRVALQVRSAAAAVSKAARASSHFACTIHVIAAAVEDALEAMVPMLRGG